jgi:hypothetical protein
VEQVIGVDRSEWVPVLAGLSVRQFGELVSVVRSRGGEQTGTGRRWGLALADRVLLVAVYCRTNLTLRQVAALFGISKSAAGRVVDHLAPLLALAPVVRRHGPGHGADRGRHAGAHPRPQRGRLQQELPLLGRPAGGHRRQYPAHRRRRETLAGQPE